MAKYGIDTSLQEHQLSELRESLHGRLIMPGNDGYDESRTVFYGGFDRRPALIVRAADADDVVRVIEFARETEMELAVRGGGHSLAGHSVVDGGIVLDLRDIRSLDIDAEQRTAWAGAGLTAGEYTRATAQHGLATGFGDTGEVGIGGITLGGGVGFFVRKYGLTIDSLLGADIVTADGQLLYVDAEHHPDLFWAIRGGGGNFGVVTRFLYRLHEVDQIVGGILVLPATADVITGVVAEAEAAPEELSLIVNVMAAPPMPFIPETYYGQLIVMVMMVYTGDVEDGEQAIAPFRALAEPIADMVRPMRYSEMFSPMEEGYHPQAVGRVFFMDNFGSDAAQTILDYLNASDAPMRVAQLRVLGGAMARVPAEDTAFAYRDKHIMGNVAAFYNGSEDRVRREKWVEDFRTALVSGDSSAYVNFIGDEGPDRVRDAYPGETWNRLVEVKSRYDPTNLFHHNQNIPAANGADGS